jgi:hypothetical protein
MGRPVMGLARVAPQDDLRPLLLLLHLSHIQWKFPTSVIYSCREGRGEIVRVERALSREGTVEGYRASRMVLVLADRLEDACSEWGWDMLRRY